MAESELIARIRQIIQSENVSTSGFAKRIGFNQSNLSKILSGTRGVPTKLLDAILNNTNINRTWLLTGEGAMLRGYSDVIPASTAQMEEYTITKNGTTFLKRQDGHLIMQVPLVPIEALGSPADEYATLTIDHEWEKTLFEVDEVHHGKYFAFRVSGNSMDDGTRRSFEKGDIVLVRELERDQWMPKLRFGDWPFWVIVFGNCIRIKQIVSQDEETGAITLHSLNPSPEYTDFTLQLNQISRLFNVVQHIPHPNRF